MTLLLASASPRRRELLTRLGVEFDAVAPEVEEIAEGEGAEVVLENARRKARAGLDAIGAGRRDSAKLGRVGEGEFVALGVDTEVVLDGRVLGKAGDVAEARERLEALSGRTHEVLSGVVLLGGGDPFTASVSKSPPGAADRAGTPPERSGVARSYVTFRPLDRELLDLYLASGEWRDRAGAYAIQGLGAALVERLEGDFANVVGLPVRLLLQLAPELVSRPAAS